MAVALRIALFWVLSGTSLALGTDKFCTDIFVQIPDTPFLKKSDDRHELNPEALAWEFESHFGQAPREIYLVGSFVHGYEPPHPHSDVDLVFVVDARVYGRHPELKTSGKFQGIGFEFFRRINPGRVDPAITGIGVRPTEGALGGNIPKAGMLDPFFADEAPTRDGATRIWSSAKTDSPLEFVEDPRPPDRRTDVGKTMSP